MFWFARLFVAVAVALAMLASGLGLTVLSADTFRGAVRSNGLPDVELRPLAQRSQILAADGSLLAAMFEQDRIPAKLAEVPPALVNAVVAVEDSAFYEHDGVSVRGLLRAVKTNAGAGGVEQGGSTITQQLIKNNLLTGTRSYDRKAKEAVLALRIEQKLTKDQILETYLNSVYFGQGAYGVRAAAQRYFAKDLETITLAEAALLAGMISNPQAFDPIRRPEAARSRRSHALRRMVGLGFASQADADAAEQVALPTAVNRPAGQPSDYFAEEVRTQLLADERLGPTPEERSALLLRGGITVHTTLDPVLQAAAEQAVRERIPPSQFTASLVAIDPSDGAVKALVGGPNFEQAKFNIATQGARQTGSSFKTIALAAWIASGRSPEDLVDATAPCKFPTPSSPEPFWSVDNYEGGSGIPIVTTLRDATVNSYNCAYARVALTLGPSALVDMAKRLGMSRSARAVPSVVLGTSEVTPLEMASIYATLAADGVHRAPIFIRDVVGPDGRVLLQNAPKDDRVLEPQIAKTITDVLRGVVDNGTGRKANIGRPAAGKTGTTQEWRDAWFAGYTPQLATAVWMGSPVGQESMANVGGIRVTGGSYPAMVWSQFMSTAMSAQPVVDFAAPDPMAWPASNWIGDPPAVLPAGYVLPPHLVPAPTLPPPPPPLDMTTTTTSTSTSTTSTTRPPRKRDRDG